MQHVSEVLSQLASELYKIRDNEISMASEVACQYITDHNDKSAYRRIERETNQLAKQWDAMIALLEKTYVRALKIESACTNFYGD